jgi:hypothetical protein
VRLDQPGVVDGGVLDAQQPPLGVGGEPDRLLHPGLVADRRELVGPTQVQLHRPPRHPGGRGGEHLVRPDVALAAEAAAGVRRDDAHVRRVDPERLADDRDDRGPGLHGVPQGEAVAVPPGDGAGGLHRVVVPGRLDVGLLDADGGLRAGGVDVALGEDDGVLAHRGHRSPEPSSTGGSAAQSTRTTARAASAASIDSPSTIATGQPSCGIRSSVKGSVNTAAGMSRRGSRAGRPR